MQTNDSIGYGESFWPVDDSIVELISVSRTVEIGIDNGPLCVGVERMKIRIDPIRLGDVSRVDSR